MKKTLKIITFCALTVVSATSMATTSVKPVTIGILVPVQLPAMTQIVNGFETTMNKESKVPVHYLVKNAQGDANIQRAILQEFNSANVNLVAPIGTDAAQMTIAMVRDKPIVAIAADHLKEQALKANNLNVTGVNSRVAPSDRMGFIHDALPNLKKLTLIYSSDSRIYTQVKQFEVVAKKDHIQVQKLMVSQLSDLYSISKNIAADSQAIFILKDELIVSGINTLVQQAEQKKIPIIASDDGSVSKGAAFALGVSEYQSGAVAAKVALQVLKGKKASAMPVHMMKHYFVFINPVAAKAQNIDSNAVKAAAKKAGYAVTIL
ncbi:MAG: ABC transporter substrate-binding protein [Gammaproteobacteria bacterium]|nr:ABC transporter substrate-binding protein [Gammaproteobacteria bacterium]